MMSQIVFIVNSSVYSGCSDNFKRLEEDDVDLCWLFLTKTLVSLLEPACLKCICMNHLNNWHHVCFITKFAGCSQSSSSKPLLPVARVCPPLPVYLLASPCSLAMTQRCEDRRGRNSSHSGVRGKNSPACLYFCKPIAIMAGAAKPSVRWRWPCKRGLGVTCWLNPRKKKM